MKGLDISPSNVENTAAAGTFSQFVTSRVHTGDVACVGPLRNALTSVDLGWRRSSADSGLRCMCYCDDRGDERS